MNSKRTYVKPINVSQKKEHTPYCRGTVFTAWDISKLETFFNSHDVPATIRLNNYSVCDDVQNMVNGHLAFVCANNGNPVYQPYLDRLIHLVEIIKKGHQNASNDLQQYLFS